jgi:hypothetical protein
MRVPYVSGISAATVASIHAFSCESESTTSTPPPAEAFALVSSAASEQNLSDPVRACEPHRVHDAPSANHSDPESDPTRLPQPQRRPLGSNVPRTADEARLRVLGRGGRAAHIQ